MLYIKRLEQSELVPLFGSEKSLVSEQVLVRVSRLGFSLAYQQKGKAEWEAFPPEEGLYSDRQGMAYFGAISDGQIIGLSCVSIGSNGWTDLLDIRVDAAYRRIGAGKAMLDACEAWGADRGLVGLRTITSDRNPAACQFLEHCGFLLGGIDRISMSMLPDERDKPLANRSCLLVFYRKNR